MGEKKKSSEERERLEALQNTKKSFLRGTFGDFFGNRGESGEDAGREKPDLSFGEAADEGAEKKKRGAAGGEAQRRPERSGKAADPGSADKDGALSSGSGKKPSFGEKIDALEEKGREITSALNSRKDALQRANDALKEVQSLLDNPLYDGMPSLSGKGRGRGTGNLPGAEGPVSEIDPGLMAGSGGDLFSGFRENAGFPSDGPSDSSVSGPSGIPEGTVSGSAGLRQTQAETSGEEKPKEPEKDPMEELDSLIGLTKIKHDVKELMDFVKIQKLRKDGGLRSVPVSLHLVFTGNPGTGKTTVARILAQLYRQIGVLSKGQLVEVDRSGLVAGYVGQTALKTAKKIEEAKGGVLFIDEAYALARKDDAFGQEAIDTILKAMEDSREDLVVIVAGYTEPMERFINSNPGLKSRFNKYIDFPDYSIDELMGIFDMNCKKYDYEADEDVKAQIRGMIVQRKLASLENFANAREVRNLFEEIITNQARRVAAMENPGQDELKKILLEDLTETAAEDAEKTRKKAEEILKDAVPQDTGTGSGEEAAGQDREVPDQGKEDQQISTPQGAGTKPVAEEQT